VHVKTSRLTDRKPSEHFQVDIDKVKEGRGEGMEAATWMRTGAVGMPKREVDPVTGHVIGGERCNTDLTSQVSAQRSLHCCCCCYCLVYFQIFQLPNELPYFLN